MGEKLYAVLRRLEDDEWSIMVLTTDKEEAKEVARLSSWRKVAIIGEMLDEGE